MFAPTTKYERISGAFALDKAQFSFMWFSLLRWFGRAVLSPKNVGKPTKAAVNVSAKYIVARAAALQVGSTVCQNEIRRSNNGCSVRGENYSRGLRKQPNPARLFAVLDTMGATCHGYKPGTRWCYKCCTRVDEETRFTSHPDCKPPVPVTNY